MAIYNSLGADTIKNMQLDAGILVLGDVNTTSWESETLILPKLGATKGATVFSAIPELRNIFDGLDGCRGYYKGGTVIDQWDVTLKTSITEMTKENIMKVLNTTTSDQVGESVQFDHITHKDTIDSGDYIATISWLGTMAGSDQPIVIKLHNVLNMNGFTITAEDKNSGTVEVEFRAHMDLSSPSKRLFDIMIPTKKTALDKSLQLEEVKIDLSKLDKNK